MKLKNFKSLLTMTIFVIESASLSSAGDKMMLNMITKSSLEHQSLSQAVTEIIRSLEGKASVTNVIKVTSPDGDIKNIDLYTETIVKHINGPFELHIRDCDDVKRTVKHSEYNVLLLLSEAKTIREMEFFLSSLDFESDKKVFIVFLDKSFPSSQNNIKLMLDIMWRKFILNVHVVTREANGDVQFHTFFPFAEDFCGQVHPVVWNIFRNQAFVKQREHFPRKDENLFRCALRVAVFNAPPYMIVKEDRYGKIDLDGIDGNLLKMLSNELNFMINFTVVSEDVRWGEIYSKENATGAFQLVSSSKQDGSLN
jgi:hypothetical protein